MGFYISNKYIECFLVLLVLARPCLRVTLTARRLGRSRRIVEEILAWSEDYVSAS